MKNLLKIVGLICLLASASFAQKTLTFAQYAVKVEKAKAKAIDFSSNKAAKSYRTRLTEALKSGVNFAGHYIVAAWGCGANCLQVAIIDARSGQVYFPDELGGVGTGMGELFEKDAIVYKPDSRLFIINGYKGGDQNLDNPPYGIYYLQWTGAGFKKIKFVPKKASTPENQ